MVETGLLSFRLWRRNSKRKTEIHESERSGPWPFLFCGERDETTTMDYTGRAKLWVMVLGMCPCVDAKSKQEWQARSRKPSYMCFCASGIHFRWHRCNERIHQKSVIGLVRKDIVRVRIVSLISAWCSRATLTRSRLVGGSKTRLKPVAWHRQCDQHGGPSPRWAIQRLKNGWVRRDAMKRSERAAVYCSGGNCTLVALRRMCALTTVDGRHKGETLSQGLCIRLFILPLLREYITSQQNPAGRRVPCPSGS